MRTRSIVRSLAAATTVLALAAAGAALMPMAASAASSTINTDSIQWTGVNNANGFISDGATYDLANNSFGWNNDAFDTFPNQFTLRDTTQGNWNFVATTTVSDIHQGGTSVITMTGTTPVSWVNPYVVVLTLTLKGNYAHWSYRLSNATIGLANSSVSFTGNIGSDSGTGYVAAGTTLVSDNTTPVFSAENDDESSDPVIGYDVVTDGTFAGWAATPGNDQPRANATAASAFDVYLVLFGYTPCANGFGDAKTAVTALVPTLPATFGDSYDSAGSCASVTPLALTTGVAVNQVLSYTIDPALTADNFFSGSTVTTVVDNLPAGLSATAVQQPGSPVTITVTGTPTAAGKFTARVLFALPGGGATFHQVLANTSITVTDPALAVAAVPELAATGIDAAQPIGLAGFLLLAGLGMIVIARRRLV